MKYISTRGRAPALDFEEVLLAGLAEDGGLFVPESLPRFGEREIAAMAAMSYPELALKIVRPFTGGCIPEDDLAAIVRDSYREFRHEAVAPLVQLGVNEWVLELFHGPTLAFKDFALQLLGRLLDHVLERRRRKAVIVGATSGDTGSAAIEGCRRCGNVDIFILHPHGRVSEVQRRQMTTAPGDNIHNIALRGNFDDCQAMVKASFADRSFLPPGRDLVAVNSINWVRIMAQIVYYFYAALAVGAPGRRVVFSVPTGNFGDIFAGYLARGMGLPVDRLIIATNRNDVLHRLLGGGIYARSELHRTLSPSMDIAVSSNFERLLFDLLDRDGEAVGKLMRRFENEDIPLSEPALAKARALFDSHRVNDAETLEAISRVHAASGYLLDPHSAVGVGAARAKRGDPATPVIALATAHPAKFPEAVAEALGKAGKEMERDLSRHVAHLFEREERYEVLPKDLGAVQSFMIGAIDA